MKQLETKMDKPMVLHAIWYGDWDWTVAARERVGGEELAVVSVNFSVPREPPHNKPPRPTKVRGRELELA